MHYNSVAAHGEKIALEEVCSLSEDAILPWEAQGDGKQSAVCFRNSEFSLDS